MCWHPTILKKPAEYIDYSTGEIRYKNQSVPCGKCVQCVKAKLSAWLFRLDQELNVCQNPLFITLTYKNWHLPKTQSFKGIPTLRKSHCQDFMKRLRINRQRKYPDVKHPPIRYFTVGEYGTKRGRPHYHIIMFNLIDEELIHDSWGMGYTRTLPLKDGGTHYVLKYVSKKSSKLREGQQPEFSLVSGGFGKNYLTEETIAWHNAAVENSHLTLNGQKVPIPKYYKEYIYGEEMRMTVASYMQQLSLDLEKQRFKKYKFKNPTFSDEKILNNLELMKFNHSLDKRLQETF